MTLADDILAASGGPLDLCGVLTSLGGVIKNAQRFRLTDEVARTCGDLAYSKPSTLNAALPLCRLPYSTIWIENRGGLGRYLNTDPGRPVPLRQGVLVESTGAQTGVMTITWAHRVEQDDLDLDIAPSYSPFAIYFDWRTDGDVSDFVNATHARLLREADGDKYIALIIEGIGKRFNADHSYAWTFEAMKKHGPEMALHAKDPKEVEAIREGKRHLSVGISPHAATFLRIAVRTTPPQEIPKIFTSWLSDVAGEGPFVECFLAMLNSKNPCLAHTDIDLTRLNKSRTKKGRSALLSHVETRLHMSRGYLNRARAAGLTREQARGTTVRGHFKVRRTGVFWWSEFDRGDQTRRVERKEYEAVQ
jgi:hypothetical protein